MNCSLSEVRKLIKILTAMGLANPPKVEEDQLVIAYHLVWGDMSADMVAGAITEYVRGGGTFWPSPGTIRTLALQTAANLPEAELAWAEVQEAIGRYGMSGTPIWSSEPLERAVESVGWRSICMTQDEDMGTLRAQFRNAYRAALAGTVAQGDASLVLRDAQDRRNRLGVSNDAVAALPARNGQNQSFERGSLDDPRDDDAPHESAARRRARLRWEKKHNITGFRDPPMRFGPTGSPVQDASLFLVALPAFRALPKDRQHHLLEKLEKVVREREGWDKYPGEKERS